MPRTIVALVALVTLAPALHAQAPDSLSARVDSLFAPWDRTSSPGAAVAVIKDGELVYSRGYGMANLEYGIPVRPSTVFHVASISKHFAAFAIGLLEEDGRLSVDDDVRKHLPELPDFGPTITLRHLLHHTSGIRDQWELLAMSGWRLDDVITMDHILKTLLRQRELNFEPGAEHLYSNSGYTLLALVVERVSGKSFRDFLHERLFQPLGMTRTHVHDDHQMIVPERAYSYAPLQGGGFRNAPLNYANEGATSLFTTVEDMARWERNFLRPAVGSPALVRWMETQGVLNDGSEIGYARGLGIGQRRGLRIVLHGGADAGYRTFYVRFPEQGWAFVAFSNLGSFNPGQLAFQVADIYLEPLYTEPAPARAVAAAPRPSGVRLTERQLAPLAGLYVDPESSALRRVVFRDGKLRLALGPGYELVPLAARRFAAMDAPAPAELTFEPAADGAPARMLERRGDDEPQAFHRAVELAPDALAEYRGTYRSEELGTSYTLEVMDGRLVARHRRHEDIELTPTLPDRFNGGAWFFRTLRFERDGQGAITGFALTGGRVRNLRFVRARG